MGASSCNKIYKQNNNSMRYSDQLIQKQNNNNKELEDNYKEYFKFVNMKLKRYYEENKNSQINISICLEKKDFNTIVTTKKIVCDPNQKFIYWKKYILNYLNKQTQKGCLWSNELYEIINAELFLSENKWLSLFFWQEYEMRTKPKCLDLSKLRKTLETNDFEHDSQNHSISDKLNGSFCSINTDTLSATDPTHEYKEFRNKVKAYMEIFKEHVFDADHPINIVARHFKIKFSAYLADKIKELHSLRNSEDIPDFNIICNMKTNLVTKELQKFIIKLQTCLRLMYSRTINYQYFIEEKDEVINLITNLVFKDGIIYSKLYELYEISLFDEIKVFETKLNELKGIKPQDLGINRKFSLNDDTLILQKNMATEKLENSNKKKKENLEHENLKRDLDPNFNRNIKYEINGTVLQQGRMSDNNLKKIDELNFMLDDKDDQINEYRNGYLGNKDDYKINVDNETDLNSHALDTIDFKAKQMNKIEESLAGNLNEDYRDSYEVSKNLLENIDLKIKNYQSDNNYEFYPSATSDATIKLNIKESIPEHNDMTDIELDYNDITANQNNQNFRISNNNCKSNLKIKNNNFNFITEQIQTSENGDLINYNNNLNLNDNSSLQFFDNSNFNVNTDDIQNQIKQNKQNLKVISETDQMTKSLKKARNKYIHNYSSYEQAIKMLKSIKRYRVPFEKMILIATLASEITECVNEFWKDFENIITSSLLNIDADELMTIFIYVVIKAHMPELLIHSKFIKEFTTSNSRSTMIGYYFTTLEASIIYILSVKDKESLRSKEKENLFSTLIPKKNSFTKIDDE